MSGKNQAQGDNAVNLQSDSDIISYKALSVMIGSPLNTCYSLVAQKRIPHIRLGRRFVRFSRQRIEQWLQEREVEA